MSIFGILSSQNNEMEDFLNELYNIATKPKIWSFVTYCLILGVVVVVVDVISYKVALLTNQNDRLPVSVFEMKYEKKVGILFSALLWCLGSAIIGYLTAMSNMVDMSFQGAFLVCLTWPLLFSRIVKSNRLKVEKDNH